MYATLSYDVNAGATPIDVIRIAVHALFVDRRTCDLLSDTFICEVASAADFDDVSEDLEQMATAYGGQFLYVFTLHRTASPLRSNASFPKAKARRIIDPGDGQ
jgi:hypothetical protein